MLQRTEMKRVAVLGTPISHSLSPRLHNYWFIEHDIVGRYEAIEVLPENLEKTLRELPAKNFIGVNLTIPHKEKALAMVDKADNIARRIGAINTIIVEDENLLGTNTDAYGFIANLKANMPDYIQAKALVLGAGGAARAVCAGLLDEGWKITLSGRTRTKANAVAQSLKTQAIDVVDWEELHDAMSGISLLVNTTPLGMKGQGPLEINLAALSRNAYVYDIVYNPLKTSLLTQAQERGNPIVEGLGMLLYQGQRAFELWFGVRPEITDELYRHMKEALV